MVSGHTGDQAETWSGRHGQTLGLLVVFHERPGDIILTFRFQQMLNRMRGAEGIPKRPHIAVKMAAVALLCVRTAVSAQKVYAVFFVVFNRQIQAAV